MSLSNAHFIANHLDPDLRSLNLYEKELSPIGLLASPPDTDGCKELGIEALKTHSVQALTDSEGLEKATVDDTNLSDWRLECPQPGKVTHSARDYSKSSWPCAAL